LWYMYHGATRALPAEKIAPVKWVAVTEIWYYMPGMLKPGGSAIPPVTFFIWSATS